MRKQIKICYLYQMLFLMLILINTDCLKHSKNKNKSLTAQTHVTSQHDNVQPQKHAQNTSMSKTQENNQNKSDKGKTEDNAQKDVQGKLIYQFVFQPKQNKYVIPITVGSDSYNLGLFFDQKQSKYGSIPSWIFTSLTGEDHQLCNIEDDCQQVTKFIQCKDNNNCTDTGSAKYSQQNLKSQRKVKVNLMNNNLNFSMEFISPKKVIFPSDNIQQNQIQGMLNLAFNNQLKYGNQIIISKNIIKIANSSEFQSASNHKQMLQFEKGKKFSLSSKEIYIHAVGIKEKNIVNSIKETYKKFKIQFVNNNLTMSAPKKAVTAIKNILKKYYFGDRCKIQEDEVSCSGPPLKNIKSIDLCNDNKGKKCLSLPVLDYILHQEKTDQSYKFLISENDDKDGETTFIVYPRVAQIYTIYGSKGVIKRVLPIINNSVQHKKNNNEQKQSNEQQEKSQQQDKSDQGEQQVKQTTKSQHKLKNSQHKEALVTAKNKHENAEEDENEQQTQQAQDSENQEKPVQAQGKVKQKTQHQLQSTANNSQAVVTDQKQSKHILFFILVYGLVFVSVLFVIKLKAQQSAAAQLIDQCLQIIWYGIVKNYFNKSRGYNAPKLQQQCGGGQQIDRSDSVAQGYSEQQGRQLFWEKNSVDGI